MMIRHPSFSEQEFSQQKTTNPIRRSHTIAVAADESGYAQVMNALLCLYTRALSSSLSVHHHASLHSPCLNHRNLLLLISNLSGTSSDYTLEDTVLLGAPSLPDKFLDVTLEYICCSAQFH